LKYIPKKEGVKGMLPLGCFPLWGREGVILQAAAENKRIEKKEDFNRAIISNRFAFFNLIQKETIPPIFYQINCWEVYNNVKDIPLILGRMVKLERKVRAKKEGLFPSGNASLYPRKKMIDYLLLIQGCKTPLDNIPIP
jgi:hypothetical protein